MIISAYPSQVSTIGLLSTKVNLRVRLVVTNMINVHSSLLITLLKILIHKNCVALGIDYVTYKRTLLVNACSVRLFVQPYRIHKPSDI